MTDKKKYGSNLVIQADNEDESGDFFPILSEEDEERIMSAAGLPDELSVLPLKNTVLFPGVIIPITVSRQKSVKLVKRAQKAELPIGVVTQKNNSEEPGSADLYNIGTVAKIIKMFVLPDGNTTIIIQGKKKFNVEEWLSEDPMLVCKVSYINDEPLPKQKKNSDLLIKTIKELATKIVKLNPEIPQEAQIAIENIESRNFLTYFLASNLNTEVAEKQKLLEIHKVENRATQLVSLLTNELQLLEFRKDIQNKVTNDIEQQQRDYFLRQQIKVLQNELDGEDNDDTTEKWREKAKKKKWPKEVQKQFDKSLLRISRLNSMSPEYPVEVNYIEYLLDLPWGDTTKDDFDLNRAQKVFDKNHYGLEKAKERILEYLAVLKLKDNMKAPIICLYGPPGVGKTSLGKSVAVALKRKSVRLALGGLHDEAEIRGHRKTYIGAMPGKIMQNIRKAESDNPVFILDEIDKVGSDFRGDPSSALLEVLDPELNSTFTDNYLDVEYDLSKVLFIATANRLDTIHPALRDRMEIIEISGYTQEEKEEIATKHLVKRQLEAHGVKRNQISFTKNGISKIIENYTRESGVRNLERQIGSIVRKIAKALATDEVYNKSITDKEVVKYLGAEVFERESNETLNIPGIAMGLAWTPTGGEILYIESSVSKGKGKLIISGQLGDVMRESAMAALSYLKAHSHTLNIDAEMFEKNDIHIHVPAGAVPKDGPSAGVTMFSALASAFMQRTLKNDIAMTGEITLRGRILPVGGIKEKILAAKRIGITNIFLPARNKKDVEELKDSYRENLNVVYLDHVNDLLNQVLNV